MLKLGYLWIVVQVAKIPIMFAKHDEQVLTFHKHYTMFNCQTHRRFDLVKACIASDIFPNL